MFLGPPQAKIFGVPDRFLRNPPLFLPDLKQGGGFLKLVHLKNRILAEILGFPARNHHSGSVSSMEIVLCAITKPQKFSACGGLIVVWLISIIVIGVIVK